MDRVTERRTSHLIEQIERVREALADVARELSDIVLGDTCETPPAEAPAPSQEPEVGKVRDGHFKDYPLADEHDYHGGRRTDG